MFDVVTTAAVVEELRRTVLDGRIQRLGMVDPLTIAAEIYHERKRWHLIASADSSNPRIHLVDGMPSTDPNLITPFGLQMRKYVRGGFLIDIEQPPLERGVLLTIAKRMGPAGEPGEDDLDDHEDDDIWSGDNVSRLKLAVEMMGRHSNLVLVDEDNVVRESAKRVTPGMSRVRVVLPKRPYELPPPMNKPDPRQVTSGTVEQLIASAKDGDKISDTFVRGFRGVSPQVGREIAFRTSGDSNGKMGDLSGYDAGEVSRIVRGLYQPLLTNRWSPAVYRQEDAIIGFSAIPMEHLAAITEVEEVDSISAAVAAGSEASGDTTPQDHAQRRAQLVKAIDRAAQSVDSRLHSLRQQHERSRDIERLRRWGETIYAYLWQIQPGDTELVAESEIGEERIPLDPDKDPKDVAADYFEDYRKAQKAGENLPDRIAAAEAERGWLDEMRLLVHQAEGFAGIEQLRQEFDEQTGGKHTPVTQKGHHSRKKQGAARVRPLSDDDGNLFYIGRSSRENDQVTFDIAGPTDLWLHARGVPGSHVILRLNRPTDEPEPRFVERAAGLAAYYSGSRESGAVEVDVTQRRHVRKIHGAGPGMVTYRNEFTIAVPPANEDALDLT